MMKNMSVFGWFGRGNCGDESYLDAFPKIFPNSMLSFYGHPNLPPDNGNSLVMGGGDVVYKKWIDLISKRKGKKHLVSVSLSSCDCLSEIDSTFDQILVRDIDSLNKLKSVNINRAKLIPDVAFSLSGDKAYGKKLVKDMFDKAGHELYERLIIIVFNAYLIGKTDTLAREEINFHKVSMDLASICDSTPASFLFLPFSSSPPHDDRTTNAWVSSRCKFWKKNLVSYDKLSPFQTLSIFQAADYAITSRLHAGIFSIIAHTPFYDLTHHSKTLGMLRTFNLEDCAGSYWKFDSGKLQHHLNTTIQSPENLKLRLKNIDEQCKKDLKEIQCISF